MNDDAALLDVLERARRLGVLGPGPIDDHVRHAEAFVEAVRDLAEGALVIDLGSGGGVPGLIVAVRRPDLHLALLDAAERRVELLREGVVALGAQDRIEVLHGRAEAVGRDGRWRGAADAVLSRSFGPPAVVAECAAPLLRPGGLLVVSEPPGEVDRWPVAGLAEVGLVRDGDDGGPLRTLRLASPCPDRYPRRIGVPAKRPLF